MQLTPSTPAMALLRSNRCQPKTSQHDRCLLWTCIAKDDTHIKLNASRILLPSILAPCQKNESFRQFSSIIPTEFFFLLTSLSHTHTHKSSDGEVTKDNSKQNRGHPLCVWPPPTLPQTPITARRDTHCSCLFLSTTTPSSVLLFTQFLHLSTLLNHDDTSCTYLRQI